MDSGCSWHVHYVRDDLINLRESYDSVTGIDENEHNVEAIGDLPAIARNHHGSSSSKYSYATCDTSPR